MSSRERTMMLVLALLGVLGIATAGYMLVVVPIEEAKADSERLETDLSTKQAILQKMLKDKPRVEAAKKRSLPADADTARVEYDAMLRRLLSKSGVPAGYTVTPKDPTGKDVPLLDAKSKKEAYKRLGFEIRMSKVEKGALAAFLRDYYQLGLLHQITKIEIKRKDDARGRSADRADLDVVILTEAIILDGAENRRTLLPVSPGVGAVSGGIGYQAVLHTPEAGRNLTPLQLAPVLASANPRDYSVLPDRDIFHGPKPPAYVPPKVEAKIEPPSPPKPKDDIAGYIKMTGVVTRSDGTAQVSITDLANKQEYLIDLTPKGERYVVQVQKFYYIGDKRKRWFSEPELVIHEDGTTPATTNRKFKVVGLDGNALVLTEATTLASAGPEEKPRGGSFSRTTKLPPPPPGAAVAGGPAAALAPSGEKVYVWQPRQTLKGLTPLTGKEADEVLRRAAPTHGTEVTKAE